MNLKKALLIGLSVATIGCTSQQPKGPEPTANNRSLAAVNPEKFLYSFEIDRAAGERFRPKDNLASEQKEYRKLIGLFVGHFKNKYGDAQVRAAQKDQGESGYALRGVHAKGHGCLSGTFTIDKFNALD